MAGHIALVHNDEGTSYGVSFPDVPGCIAAGDTFEEAIANAADAIVTMVTPRTEMAAAE